MDILELIQQYLDMGDYEIFIDDRIENDSIGYTEAWGVGHIDKQPDYRCTEVWLKFKLPKEQYEKEVMEDPSLIILEAIRPYLEDDDECPSSDIDYQQERLGWIDDSTLEYYVAMVSPPLY